MKTAVTEVLECFEQFGLTITQENKNKFLETEKQQIIEAYNSGWQYGFFANINEFQPTKNNETYYNETFKN